MNTLGIDIETFSSVDLKKSGMYKYAESPDFEILLFAYRIDNGPVKVVDLCSGETIPGEVSEALTDPAVHKTAHNAAFERTCIAAFFKVELPPDQWYCTMILAGMAGLPFSLDAAGRALHLSQQKNADGKALIRYFCIPCKPSKVNGGRTRNLPEHDIEKWLKFISYCAEDVLTEQAIRSKLGWFRIPEKERRLWALDQKINDRGILIDVGFVKAAMRIDAEQRISLIREAEEITALANPNSGAQLIRWLAAEMPLETVEKLRIQDIPGYREAAEFYLNAEQIKRVLEIRQELSKTSIKKYGAMLAAVCRDNRLRGLHQYYGANRTGRWAGRLVQPQNLTKNEFEFIKKEKGVDYTDIFRDDVRNHNGELAKLVGPVSDILSNLIRTSFIAPAGTVLGPSDFSAIEARVIAWLAGEQWRLEVFNTHGKIYEASASKMFNIPLEQVTKGSVYRQKGKMAELALGYQGGPNAIIKIEISNKTPVEKRIPEDDLQELVDAWRKANRKIVKLWYDVQAAAISAVQGTPAKIQFGIYFFVKNETLHIKLPSGRCLCYVRPAIRKNRFDKDSIVYEGMNQTTKQWGRQETYGGKLVENIVQAIARDLLADKMLDTDAAGFPIVLHVHDETNTEITAGSGSLEQITEIMRTPVAWAPGLPLNADSYETPYYRKED